MKDQFLCPGCGYNLFCCTQKWIEEGIYKRGWKFSVICVRCRRVVGADDRDKIGTQEPEEGEKMNKEMHRCNCNAKSKEDHEAWCRRLSYLDRVGDECVVRAFASGATRDVDDKKYDYEGFLSPRAIRRYGEYMNKHKHQADGSIRASDNWQRGIPIPVYMKSLLRHTLDAHAIHRGLRTFDTKDGSEVGIEDTLCAILFNAFGYLHEHLKQKEREATNEQG